MALEPSTVLFMEDYPGEVWLIRELLAETTGACFIWRLWAGSLRRSPRSRPTPPMWSSSTSRYPIAMG